MPGSKFPSANPVESLARGPKEIRIKLLRLLDSMSPKQAITGGKSDH
jgi:hypothetical protein